MKRENKWMILAVVCWCILLFVPLQVRAEAVVQPPTGVETDMDLVLLGWPGGIPSDILVQWEPSETEGIQEYCIYEIIAGQDGISEYVKVGYTGADETAYLVYYENRDIVGSHRFAVTAIMPDGQESDYSEIAESRIYYHLDVRDKEANGFSVSLEWDQPAFSEADSFEIWYCQDEYEYWEYYDSYYYEYGSGVSENDIKYQKIKGLEGSADSYRIQGLKPDTGYVFMVQAYRNGKPLDHSDFLQVRTAASEPLPMPEPPTEVKTNYKLDLLGWPGLIFDSVTVQWKKSESEGVAGYNIYEIVTDAEGNAQYEKRESVDANCSYCSVSLRKHTGYFKFVVTAVMEDGRESDYSNVAEYGMFFHMHAECVQEDTNSVSIKWDAPAFQEADSYEIWYCKDEYSYPYYQYSGGTEWEKSFQKIKGIAGNVRSYQINGLKPDTEYVFSVRAYSNGEPLDRSDFHSMKTTVPEWTQAIVFYKDASTGETLKTEAVSLLKPGEAFVWQPVASFTENGKCYEVDLTKPEQVLQLEALRYDPEENSIIVYYMEKKEQPDTQPKLLKVGQVSLSKPVKLAGQKVKLKWKKVSGADGYEIVYAANKQLKKATIKITVKKSITLKKLKKGSTYYVKVRAYKLDSAGKKVYGKYSKKKKIVVS